MSERTFPLQDMNSQMLFAEAVQDPEVAGSVEAWSQVYNKERLNYQLSQYDLDESIESSFEIREHNEWSMLLWHGCQEEAVLSVVGMVVEANLPPIGRDARFTRQPHKAHEVTQSLSLAALPGGSYAKAVSALRRIFRFMSRRYRVGQLTGMPSLTCGGLDVIKASKRYLTPLKDRSWPDATIDPSIDPLGALQRMVSQGHYRYTTDNVVEYFECPSKNYELVHPASLDPSLIRPGQVVEMAVTFRGLKRGDRRIFLVGLDSVTLLDRIGVSTLNRLASQGDVERKRITCSDDEEKEEPVKMPTKRGGRTLVPPAKRIRDASDMDDCISSSIVELGK